MEDLIKIQVKNGHQLVSARELHKNLGLTTRFSKWVDQNFNGFEKDQDFTSVTAVTDMPNGGVKPIQDYVLTIDMAKELCMMSKTEKGKEVRKYFIQVEKYWNSPEMVMHRALEFSNARIKQLTAKNQSLVNQNKDLQDKIDRDADDVLFSHAIGYSNHSITVRELAAILTQSGYVIGQNQLYELLRLKHFISKYSTLPMGSKIKLGYFRIKHGIKNGHAYSQTLITPKGQKHILSKCLRGTWDDAYQQVVANTLGI